MRWVSELRGKQAKKNPLTSSIGYAGGAVPDHSEIGRPTLKGARDAVLDGAAGTLHASLTSYAMKMAFNCNTEEELRDHCSKLVNASQRAKADPGRIDRLFASNGLSKPSEFDRIIKSGWQKAVELKEEKSAANAFDIIIADGLPTISTLERRLAEKGDLDWIAGEKDGRPKDHHLNRLVAFLKSGVNVRFNERDGRKYVSNLPGFADGVEVDDTVCMEIITVLGLISPSLKPAPGPVMDIILQAAKAHPFDPFCDYLKSLQGKWDGVKRVERLWPDYFGAVDQNGVPSADPAYLSETARCFLTSVVMRSRFPGCKVDTMPVLFGEQGRKKSSGLEALLPPLPSAGYFELNIGGHLSDKEVIEVTKGAVIIEDTEMQVSRKADANAYKAFLSKKEDRARPAYGRTVETVRRRFVCVGTTNDEEFLTDNTGSRRFWPIRIQSGIDPDKIAADRDQIWAEIQHMIDVEGRTQYWLEAEIDRISAEIGKSVTKSTVVDDIAATLERKLKANEYAWAWNIKDNRQYVKRENAYRLAHNLMETESIAKASNPDLDKVSYALKRIGFVKKDRITINGKCHRTIYARNADHAPDADGGHDTPPGG